MPVPLAGSASGCARTGTSTPNTGVRTAAPTRSAYRSSSGWQTSATHAGSSSGRVVSISTSRPSGPVNRSRWYAPGRSRSSSSACATAVPYPTSHRVGASAWYASPRARLRRNARWLAARAADPIVVYVSDQSTDSPSRRHSASNAFSSSTVSSSHSSMKLRREIAVGFFRAASSTGAAGGRQSLSYGNDGSGRTPYTFCTRRSVGSPLSSQPIG